MLTTIETFEGENGIVLFPPAMTVLIWSTTKAGRSIRQLILDYYVNYVYSEALEPHMDEHTPDFLKELLLTTLRHVDANCESSCNPVSKHERNGCHYHDHDAQNPNEDCL